MRNYRGYQKKGGKALPYYYKYRTGAISRKQEKGKSEVRGSLRKKIPQGARTFILRLSSGAEKNIGGKYKKGRGPSLLRILGVH